jgi:hypothetical protein
MQQERKSDKLSFRTFTIQSSCSGVAASWFMAPLDTAIISWRSQGHFEPRIAESSVDTPDGRIDTRFPRLHFPRHGKFRRSILLRSVHRKDTVYARTFSFLDSPLQFRPFEFRNPPAPITAALQVLT